MLVFVPLANGSDCEDAETSVTLVWNDTPGYVSCKKCLVDDLDLLVQKTSTDGSRTTHYSNALDGKDSINNVEHVRMKTSDGDSIVVTVTSANLHSA